MTVTACAPTASTSPLAIGGRYLAKGGVTESGGDWYDIISLGGGDIALVIGDAVGHGAEAAPAMVKLRGALQGFAGTNGRSPATVVGQKAGRCPQLALDGLRQLRRATANGPRDIDELRDQVLRALGQDTVQQDDIALLAVRIHLPPEE